MLHLLKVNLIVEVYDILCLPRFLIDHTLCVNLSDILLAWEEVSIVVDDGVEGDLLLITNLGNWIDGTHHELIEMSIHQELRLTTEHRLDDTPDNLLDLLWNLKHLTQLNCCLSTCLQYSTKKEIVGKNFLHVLILRDITIHLFLHVV